MDEDRKNSEELGIRSEELEMKSFLIPLLIFMAESELSLNKNMVAIIMQTTIESVTENL